MDEMRSVASIFNFISSMDRNFNDYIFNGYDDEKSFETFMKRNQGFYNNDNNMNNNNNNKNNNNNNNSNNNNNNNNNNNTIKKTCH